MIIFRQKNYSRTSIMIDRVINKLDRAGYRDYDVVKRVPDDSISVTADLSSLKIYLPKDYEYEQYDIDDFLRALPGFIRTRTVFDGDIYVMTVSGKLTEDQYYKLLKFIIDENEFVAIINNEEEI